MAAQTNIYVSTFHIIVIIAASIMTNMSLASLYQAPHAQGETSWTDIMIRVWIVNYIHVK